MQSALLPLKSRIACRRSGAGNVTDMRAGITLVSQNLAGLQHAVFKVSEIIDVIRIKILLVYHNGYKTTSVGIVRSVDE